MKDTRAYGEPDLTEETSLDVESKVQEADNEDESDKSRGEEDSGS